MFVIAGGSGRTGARVASALLDQGHAVRVVVRSPEQAARWHARGAEVAVSSLEDALALERALEGADGLYALVPEDLRAQDLRATRRRIVRALAKAASASQVGHVVLLSAQAAVLPAGNGPAAELHDAERVLAAATSRLTILRASYFQENVAGALPAVRASGSYPNFFSRADLRIPMVASADVAKLATACLLAAPRASEVVDVLGPSYSASDVAALLSSLLRRSITVWNVPADARVQLLTQAGLEPGYAHGLVELHACLESDQTAPRGQRSVSCTTSLEETLTARAPSHRPTTSASLTQAGGHP